MAKEPKYRDVYLQGFTQPIRFPDGTTDDQVQAYLRSPEGYALVGRMKDNSGYLDAFKSGLNNQLGSTALSLAGPDNEAEARVIADKYRDAATAYTGPQLMGDVGEAFSDRGATAGLGALSKVIPSMIGGYAVPLGVAAVNPWAGLALGAGANLSQAIGGNVERQMATKPDQPVNYDLARGTGLGQAAAMTGLEALTMGGMNPAAMNALVQQGAKQGVKDIAQQTAKGAAVGAASNVPFEALTRAQAGQSMNDAEAWKDYADQAMTGAALVGPFAGIGAVQHARELNGRIGKRFDATSRDFMGANIPPELLQNRQAVDAINATQQQHTADTSAVQMGPQPVGLTPDMFSGELGANQSSGQLSDPSDMAKQLTAYRDMLQQKLIDQSGGTLDKKAAQKAANKMAAKQERLSQVTDAAPAPEQLALADQLARPDVELTPQQQRMSAAQLTPAPVMAVGGPRPEGLTGNRDWQPMSVPDRAQAMRDAQNAFSRAPIQDNGLMGVTPEQQSQQFAAGMQSVPQGQTPDMLQLPSIRQVSDGVPPPTVTGAAAPIPDIRAADIAARTTEPSPPVETAPAAPTAAPTQREAAGQERLPLANKPLDTEMDQASLLPEPTPADSASVVADTPSVSVKLAGSVKLGETPAQTVSRELSNLKRDALGGKSELTPDEAALAKRADKKVVEGLMSRVNRELGAQASAKAGAEGYTPGASPVVEALRRVALSPEQIPDNIRNAAEVVHKRLTGAVPAEAVPAPGQTTFLSKQGKVLPAAFRGVPDENGVVVASGKLDKATKRSAAMGQLNPDIGKTRSIAPYQMPRNGVDMANWLSRTASQPWMREFSKKISPHLDNVPVALLDASAPADVFEFGRRTESRGVMAYDPKTQTASVYFHPEALSEDVMLHELTHAATEQALQLTKNRPIRNEIDALRRHVLGQLGDDQEFFKSVLTNPEEFLAYAHTSPTLREMMKSIDAPKKNGASPVKMTVWDRFVDAIRRLLGMSARRVNEMLGAGGNAMIVGKDPSAFARMDELLNRVLEAREPDIPFSEAAKAAYNIGGPVARANLGMADVMNVLPKDVPQAKKIAKDTIDNVSEFLDRTSNAALSNLSSYENRIRGVIPGVDMVNGAARPDIIAQLAGNATQVFQQVVEHGGMRLTPENVWEVVDKDVNLKRAIDNAVRYANKYKMQVETWRQRVTDYAEAYRQDDISKHIDALMAKLPQDGVDSARYKNLVKSMQQSMEVSGGALTKEQLKEVRASAKKLLDKELLTQSGLTADNAAALRDTIKRLSGTVTLSPREIAERLAITRQLPEVESARKELRQVLRQGVDAAHEAGLFSKEYANELNGREGFISFARLKDFDPSDFDSGKRGGLRAMPELHEIYGDTTPIKDVYESTHDMLGYLTRGAIKAHAGKAMADGAIDALGARQIERSDVTNDNRDRVVSYVDKGKVKFLELQNANDVNAFKGYSVVQSRYLGLFNGAKAIANLARTTIVLDPAFAARQLLMDADSAGLMAGVKNPLGVTKDTMIYGAKLMAATLRNKELNDPYVLRLQRHGITGRYDVAHINELSNIDALHSAPSSVLGLLSNKGRNAVRYFERVAANAELAQRVAIMKRVEMEGGSLVDQLHRAQGIMDYNRRGTSPITSVLAQTVPFVASRLSSTHLLLRTLAGRGLAPGARKEALTRLAQNVMVMTAVHSLYAMMAAENDDIKAQPVEQRYRNMYIPMGNGNLFAIPVRPEPALLFKWLPERLWSLMKADESADSPQLAAKDFGTTLANAFLWDLPLPAAVKPIAENYTNHSFFTGKSIVPDYMADMPKERQFTDTTTPISKALGQAMGMSPMMLDNLMRGYTGALSMYASSVVYHLANEFSDAPQPAHALYDEPFVRSFVKNANVNNQAVNDFYEMQGHIQGAASAYKQALLRGDMDGATALHSQYAAELSNRQYIGAVGRQLQQVNLAMHRINNSDLDASSKLMQIEQLRAVRVRLAAQVQKLKTELNQ